MAKVCRRRPHQLQRGGDHGAAQALALFAVRLAHRVRVLCAPRPSAQPHKLMLPSQMRTLGQAQLLQLLRKDCLIHLILGCGPHQARQQPVRASARRVADAPALVSTKCSAATAAATSFSLTSPCACLASLSPSSCRSVRYDNTCPTSSRTRTEDCGRAAPHQPDALVWATEKPQGEGRASLLRVLISARSQSGASNSPQKRKRMAVRYAAARRACAGWKSAQRGAVTCAQANGRPTRGSQPARRMERRKMTYRVPRHQRKRWLTQRRQARTSHACTGGTLQNAVQRPLLHGHCVVCTCEAAGCLLASFRL